MSLKRIALVTGAARGIGRAIALRLSKDGLDVAVNDIPSKKEILNSLVQEINANGNRSLAVTADVSVDGEVKGMVEKVVKILGGLDVMVANAGLVTLNSVIDTTARDIDNIHALNVRGTFLCYKYAAIQMIAQGRGGRIVGASSGAGKKGEPLMSAYCASKFAIRGLTQAAASELGKHGITVNAYAPGAIRTPMLDQIDERLSELGMGEGPGSFYKSVEKRTVVGYNGTPSGVASLVSFIVSKDAHYITGQSILCDGGVHFD